MFVLVRPVVFVPLQYCETRKSQFSLIHLEAPKCRLFLAGQKMTEGKRTQET